MVAEVILPGQTPLRMYSYVDEQRAEDKQVGAVVDGILDESGLYFACDGEASWAGVRLHKGQKKPGKTHTHTNTSICLGCINMQQFTY